MDFFGIKLIPISQKEKVKIMNNQNQFKFLNKGISTPIGIFIIVLVTIIAGAGIFAYQYYWLVEEEIEIPEEAQPPSEEKVEIPEEAQPLDKTVDWRTYQDIPFQDLPHHKPWGYEFKYPQEFILKSGDHSDYPTGSFLKSHQGGAGIWSSPVVVSVRLPASAYSGTNFQSAWLTIAYDSDIANFPTCQELEKNRIIEKMTKSQVIKGVTWYKGITDGVALGTTIKSRVYHAFHNDMCYETSLHIATAAMESYGHSLLITEVNESEVWNRMEDIRSTFRFLGE